MGLTNCTGLFVSYQSLHLEGENSDFILHIGRNPTPADSVFRLSVQYLNQSASLTDETQEGVREAAAPGCYRKKKWVVVVNNSNR